MFHRDQQWRQYLGKLRNRAACAVLSQIVSSVSFVYTRGITLAAAVASLSPETQLSSCKLLHFSSTNRIAECLGHYVYIQGYELPSRALAAILCTRAPIKDAAREHRDRSEG